ncbi:MAG TPA: DUF2723 domain-containing protein [Patescibacteria group bacterium]|nr:DUF2723 domain-containing protein [Patescibacteria group bacterium]
MQFLKRYFPFLLFFFFLALYIHNLSRSVYGGDVGDFVTAAMVGGVAHPPGYPLFTLLAFIMVRVFAFFHNPAFSVGLLSSLFGAAGLTSFFFLIKKLTKSSLAASVAAVTLGVSYLYWFYAEIAEVFAFHSFFVITLFLLAVYFDDTRKKRYLYLFSFLLGCAFVTHQTILFFVPSYIIILFPSLWQLRKQPKSLFLSLGLVVSCLLWYGYVIIASSHNPVVNWDNVHDFSSFLRLFFRKDYGTFQAGLFPNPVWQQRLIILRTYLFTMLTQATIPVVVVSFLGMIALWFQKKRYLFAFLLAFILSGPVFITYAGFPLEGDFFFGIYERFFVMSFLVIFFFFPYGLVFLAKFLEELFDRPLYFYLVQILFLLIPLQLFFFNMPKTDLSQVVIGDNLGYDFLSPLPFNSTIILGGDTALFNTWYVKYALHFRPDVRLINLAVIEKEPYIENIKKQIKKSNPNMDKQTLLAEALKQMDKQSPVFVYDQIHTKKNDGLIWEPYGMLSHLVSTPSASVDTFTAITQSAISKIHLPYHTSQKALGNYTISDIPRIYAKSLVIIGNYYLTTYKDTKDAEKYYLDATKVDINYDAPWTSLGVMYLTSLNECDKAKNALENAIDRAPLSKFPYFLLYTTYGECYHDKVKAKAVQTQYQKVFNRSFLSDLADTLKSYQK